MRRFLIVFLFCWIAASCLGQADRKTAEAHVKTGNPLFDRGDYGGAQAEYEAAVKADPGWYEAHYELAQTLWVQKKFLEADAEAAKAFELEPKCWFCVALRGSIADDAGKPEEALKLYQKAAEVAPARAKPRFEAAITLIHLERYDEAIVNLKKAEELEPNYPSPYFALGNLYFAQGKFFLADEQYTRAIRLEPNSERTKKIKSRSDHQIVVDSSAPEDESVDALSYCITRAADMLPEEYHKRRPGAETYADDLEDDAKVYSSWAQIISEGDNAKASKLFYLVNVRDAGYMKAFLLTVYPDRYQDERSESEKTASAKLAEFRQWARQENVPLSAPRIRCEVRWMERTW
jgi:tetratricopeptide (TPR) repeat protein